MGADEVTWRRAWQSKRGLIRLGEHADGRWLVWRSTGKHREFWDERAACEYLQKAMSRSRWEEVTTAGTSHRPDGAVVFSSDRVAQPD
ncbi:MULTISPECIES: hypothetical protein [unclassified Actinoplanes]|uniref:hypothetical protein n=1 Tax=unclassified Actinoplanes TaxID=2626549 RepID=UPI00043A369F|nr:MULTISPECIES: hypothetical protein [unclassified Actinoplanes]